MESTSASKTFPVSIDLSSLRSQVEGSKSERPRRKVSKPAPVEAEDIIDDEDKDPPYVPPIQEPGDEEEEEEQDKEGESSQPSSQMSSHLASQQASISSGIPKLPPKKKVAKEENLKYPCDICNKKFQRTSELRDHKYTKHLGMTYDCAESLKCYQTKKALVSHQNTHHKGIGNVKCNQPDCTWQNKDPGKYHNHLLTVHGIGEPIQCKIVGEDGNICGNFFTNTRSFQQHASFHMEKKFQCQVCSRWFSTEDKIRGHVRKYHKEEDSEDKFQCDMCGGIFDNKLVFENHRKLHMLQHHRMLQQQKATKSSRGQAPASQPHAPAPAPAPSSGETSQASGSADLSTGAQLVIGKAIVVKKGEDVDLEEALEKIEQQEQQQQQE